MATNKTTAAYDGDATSKNNIRTTKSPPGVGIVGAGEDLIDSTTGTPKV